jgi:hypothetical protein
MNCTPHSYIFNKVNKMNKKGSGMVPEQLIYLILGALVLFVLVFVIFMGKPILNSFKDTQTTTSSEGKGVLDNLANMFGNKCKEGQRCSWGYLQRCIDGKWVSDANPCKNGCNSETAQCNP